MKVGDITTNTALAVEFSGPKDSSTKKSFAEVIRGLGEDPLGLGEAFQNLKGIKSKLLDTGKLSTQELILYQVRASEFGLRVEVVSKVAESGLQTIKRFQQSNG